MTDDGCQMTFTWKRSRTIFRVEAYEYISPAPGLLSRFVPVEQRPECPPRSRGRNFGVLLASRIKQACRYWGRLGPAKTIWRHMDEISFPTYFYKGGIIHQSMNFSSCI